MSTTVTRRISGNASGGQTARVSGDPTWTFHTSRIHHLLILEGDAQADTDDCLLLEGDAQSGTDALRLEGDVTVIGGTTTRRVTEAVV